MHTMPLDPINSDEYLPQCNFRSLHNPNVNHIIINELPNTGDYIGYLNRLKKYDLVDKVLSVDLWTDLANRLMNIIQQVMSTSFSGVSITQQSILVKRMQKELTQREEALICSFEDQHVVMVPVDGYISRGRWRATLGVLARCVIDLIKNDMCSDSTSSSLEISTRVESSFTEEDISALYSSEMLSTLYYIAGWHITACFKAGKIRARKKGDGELGKTMIEFFECRTVNKADAINLPTEKIE